MVYRQFFNCKVDYSRLSSTVIDVHARPKRLAGPTRDFAHPSSLSSVPALGLNPFQPLGRWEGRGKAEVDRFKRLLSAATGGSLWIIILTPVLAISWFGFYTVARDIGIPVLFAAGLSSTYDGITIFAARIGLKHRRKGFSGYLARIVVIVFAALGSFVQSFHAQTAGWIHAHSWIVWATAPIAAVIAYELHLGWVNRKQLIRHGHSHPSAKSGFGPATWILTRGTFAEYRNVLLARRAFITASNLKRFELEEAMQPQLVQNLEPVQLALDSAPTQVSVPNPQEREKIVQGWYSDETRTEPVHESGVVPIPWQLSTWEELQQAEAVHETTEPNVVHDPDGSPEPVPAPPIVVPIKRAAPAPEPVPSYVPPKRAAASIRPPASRPAPKARPKSGTSVKSAAKRSAPRGDSSNMAARDWCVANGYELGYNNRVPIDGLRAYRAAMRNQAVAS